jgi:hypothetical protein
MSAQYEDVKWGDDDFGSAGGTVTYAFADPRDPTDYSYTAELDSYYQQVVTYCLAEWSSYADIDFLYTTDVANADIVFGWDTIDGASGTLAETTYTYTRDGVLVEAEIRFDTAEQWAATTAETSGSEISFEAVALHEIGHALGLDHATSTDSIMYAYYGYELDLTPTDINAIEALYGAQDSAFSAFTGWSFDGGGREYGYYQTGELHYGWHYDYGWDFGDYMTSAGWEHGWYLHQGVELGWYGVGGWAYGWHYDYGGWGWGTNTGSAGGSVYGYEYGWWTPTAFTGWSFDGGGWEYGYYQTGGMHYGWHYDYGWDFGDYMTSSGWAHGWFLHEGRELGWYGTGSRAYGWHYDYGGWGWGSNLGSSDGGIYGYEYGWWTPSWYSGWSRDYGGYEYGYYQTGGWTVGWHTESSWEYGYYETSSGWQYGWYIHQGDEYGWYAYGSWAYGWHYDYGGWGYGENLGAWSGGFYGYEYGLG